MALEMTAEPDGDGIKIQLQIDSSGAVAIPLDRYESFALLASIASALSRLPGDPTAPIHTQNPVLRSKHPSFQVGLRGDGDVVLAIRPDPLPPFEFDISVEAAGKLIEGLRNAVITPRGSSSLAN